MPTRNRLYFSVQSKHIQNPLCSVVLILLWFSWLHNDDKIQCFRNEPKNPRSKTEQHMDHKQLSWIHITKNPPNNIFEKNKNIISLINTKSIYVENLLLPTYQSVLSILYFFSGSNLFYSIVLL